MLHNHKLFRYKQHYMTLLEVLIALGLLILLLTTLLGIYRYVDSMQQEIRKAEIHNFRFLYVQFRLGKIIPHATSFATAKKSKDDFYFYTSNTTVLNRGSSSLVFTYDNGITEPEFANTVIGKLFLDSEGRLCLLTWPTISRNSSPSPPMRKEILMEGVEKIAFAFYLGPKNDAIKKIVDPEASKNYGKWHLPWPPEEVKPEEVSLPPMMRFNVWLMDSNKKAEPDLSYAFLLPNSEQFIHYHK